MPNRTPRAALALLVLLAAACAACGRGMSGHYEEESGIGTLDFQEDGTVYVSVLGVTVAGDYSLDGERVIIQGPHGSQVLTRRGNRLEGGPGLTYVKSAAEPGTDGE